MFVAGPKGQKVEVKYSKGQLTPSNKFRKMFENIRFDDPVPGEWFKEDNGENRDQHKTD